MVYLAQRGDGCQLSEAVRIEIQLFAAAVDKMAGLRRIEVVLPSGATLSDLRRQVIAEFAPLATLAQTSRWAVRMDFVADDYRFTDSQSVAMIPPVSGG